MYQKVSVAVILLAGGATLTLLLHLSWPGVEPAVTLRASDYWGLLSLALWVLAPYLALLVKARKPQAVPWRNVVMLIGSAIIGAGGFGLYLDAGLRYPEPLSALTFLAVPLYQWMAVFLLLLILSRWVHFLTSFRSVGQDNPLFLSPILYPAAINRVGPFYLAVSGRILLFQGMYVKYCTIPLPQPR